ncbi:invasion associated locus B family protein [Roseinatronobacter sp. HJB301]|uniref:Invasion associated locus B family protein n=2 Tax=Roseinatronobacter alkalisoli TaxID=3028235 RepID=A0ABT5TA15_9RHOB|nr:invasion associated locus B family protein [Roseinatronobacter sp. HJB301]
MTTKRNLQCIMVAASTGLALLATAGLMAVPVSAQTEIAESAPDSLREDFRDWIVNCVTIAADAPANAGARVCEMFQQIDHQESGQRVLTFSVRINDEDQPISVLITPFGLRLAEGVRVQIGDEQIAHLGFETCLPEGCLVVAPMDPAMITAMRQAREGAVVLVSRQGDALGVPISLMGFAAGLERLRALSGE